MAEPPEKIKRSHAPQKKSLIVTGRDGHASVLFRLPHHAFCTVCNVNIDISHQGATGNEHSMMHIIRES